MSSIVFYLMPIYAPRQVAEHEGTAVGWIIRLTLFIASSLLGVRWLRAL